MSEEDKEKSVLLPRLRFPTFSEAWRADRVGEIAEIFKGKGIAKSDISNDGIHPCIRYGELYTVYGELVTEVLSRTSLPATDLFFGESNDVIIPSSGETKEDIATAACVIPSRIAFGGDLNVLRTKEIGAFLSYYLNGPLRKGIARVAQGNSVVHLYPHQIEKLPIAVPARNEQEKIADCLSSLDELISAETQKLDALKTHKKALMQQLFPRVGETIPRLRFPEFREAGEWEASLLGGFIEEYREKSSSQDEHEVLTSARSGLIRQRDYYDNDRITERDNVGFNVIPPNYLTYRSRSDDRRFYFNENNLGITGIISTYYPVFRINGGCNRFFIEQLSHYAELVGKHSVGTSQTVLSLNELRRIKLPTPKEPEQKRIADFLSSLDELITAQSQKLDAFKTHKKGLMQQLFPVLDEVPA